MTSMVSLGHQNKIFAYLNRENKQRCACSLCKGKKSGYKFITACKEASKFQASSLTKETKDQIYKTHTSSCLALTTCGWVNHTCAVEQNLTCACYHCKNKQEDDQLPTNTGASSSDQPKNQSPVENKSNDPKVTHCWTNGKVSGELDHNSSFDLKFCEAFDLNKFCESFSQVTIEKSGDTIKLTAQK